VFVEKDNQLHVINVNTMLPSHHDDERCKTKILLGFKSIPEDDNLDNYFFG
jgi:hypothetical protein